MTVTSPDSSPTIAAPEPGPPSRMWLRRFGIYLAALLLAWGVVRFVAQPYEVEGLSMTPALAEDDEVLVGKWAAHFGALQPGDIVVVRREAEPEWVLIKRIVAGPGDTISFRSGLRQLDGRMATEPWLTQGYKDLGVMAPMRLGDDEFFVAGDNRWDSRDSRSFGPVHRNEIVGRVWGRLWPLNRFGSITRIPDEPPSPLLNLPGSAGKHALNEKSQPDKGWL